MNHHRKPVAVTAPQASVRAEFEACGVPTFRDETDAIDALRQYSRLRRSPGTVVSPAASPDVAVRHGLVDEADSLALLASAGLPVVEHLSCSDAGGAAMAAEALGAKVVVKGCAAQIPHKSEHGLVHVGVQGAAAVSHAAADCLAKLAALGVEQGRVIVARMEKGLHEFMLGATIDPVFGPIVMIGEGGTLVEIRHDVVSLLAPFSVDDALDAIGQLKIAPVLKGFRGQPALDAHALATAAVALGEFALAHRNSLVSVDMNPVMMKEAGQGAVVVDAVVEFRSQA